MTVNKRAAISPGLVTGFEKFFYGQMWNYQDKLKMIGWNSLDITPKNERAIFTHWISLTGALSKNTFLKFFGNFCDWRRLFWSKSVNEGVLIC